MRAATLGKKIALAAQALVLALGFADDIVDGHELLSENNYMPELSRDERAPRSDGM